MCQNLKNILILECFQENKALVLSDSLTKTMFLYETGKALPLSHRNMGITSGTSGQHDPQEFLTGAMMH